MKQLVKNYTFNASAKTVTFTDFATINLDRVQLITDVTANVIIYQFNSSALGGSASSNVLSLTYNTASLNNGDHLQIVYDAAAGDPIYDLPEVSGTVASGAADSGNPVKVGGIYHASTPTFADGQRGDLQLDSSGNTKFYMATKLDSTNDAITTYPFGHSYQNISSNATTTLKSSAGVLVGLTVGNVGSSWVATIYDSTSGSVRLS